MRLRSSFLRLQPQQVFRPFPHCRGHDIHSHRAAFVLPNARSHIRQSRPQPHRQNRLFSTSNRYHSGSKPVNHYEVLRLPPTATKAELKKQFYALSKETHPDRHPDDPTAAERFSQLSESYSILGNDEKRKRYDRDFLRTQQASSPGGSGTYAGSRPASGLSKRRGTFRGPPPSFYAQGGTQTAQQQAEQQHRQQEYMAGTFNAQAFTDRGAYADFNPDPTLRTQSAEDQRRARRRTAEYRAMQAEMDALSDNDFWGRFIVVTTVIALSVTLGSIIVSMNNAPKGGLTRADGSRRGGVKNDWAKGSG